MIKLPPTKWPTVKCPQPRNVQLLVREPVGFPGLSLYFRSRRPAAIKQTIIIIAITRSASPVVYELRPSCPLQTHTTPSLPVDVSSSEIRPIQRRSSQRPSDLQNPANLPIPFSYTSLAAQYAKRKKRNIPYFTRMFSSRRMYFWGERERVSPAVDSVLVKNNCCSIEIPNLFRTV